MEHTKGPWETLAKVMADPIKLWLVICGWDYEGSDVKAILPTLDEAKAVAEKYRDKEHFSYDSVDVVEWHLGEITDRRWEHK